MYGKICFLRNCIEIGVFVSFCNRVIFVKRGNSIMEIGVVFMKSTGKQGKDYPFTINRKHKVRVYD